MNDLNIRPLFLTVTETLEALHLKLCASLDKPHQRLLQLVFLWSAIPLCAIRKNAQSKSAFLPGVTHSPIVFASILLILLQWHAILIELRSMTILNSCRLSFLFDTIAWLVSAY